MVEGGERLEVTVVVELPEPFANLTIELVILTQDTSATCKTLLTLLNAL